MDIIFTDRELDVMAVLWDHGPATVAEVRERITDPLAYTTVLTILRTLEEKGYVGHTTEGRAHRYGPLVDRSDAGVSALKRVTQRLFRKYAVQYLLLRTHFSEGLAFARVSDSLAGGVFNRRVSAAELDFDYESSFRTMLDVNRQIVPKTLAVRVRQACANAMAVAQRCAECSVDRWL